MERCKSHLWSKSTDVRSAFNAGWIWVPASPDVFRAFTSVTRWGNIMCLFIFHNISVLACSLHFLPSLQEVGLSTGSSMCLAGCRCCCGVHTHTDSVVHFDGSTIWSLAQFSFFSGSPRRDVLSLHNSFPLGQIFPANTITTLVYIRWHTRMHTH